MAFWVKKSVKSLGKSDTFKCLNVFMGKYRAMALFLKKVQFTRENEVFCDEGRRGQLEWFESYFEVVYNVV